MYDSLLVLATAAKNLEYHMDSILFRYQDGNVSCKNEIPWMEGTTFFNYLNAVTVTGITGNISFQVSNILIKSCSVFNQPEIKQLPLLDYIGSHSQSKILSHMGLRRLR
jgi:hypothetical protein